MRTYARIVNGVVAELMPLDDRFTLADAVHPSLASQFVDATAVAGVAQGWLYANGTFTPPPPPSLDTLRARKIVALRGAAAVYMTGGFVSSALGAEHTYPSQNTPDHPDQQNLAASVLASMLPGLPADWTTPFWCAVNPADPASWSLTPHTGAQIQKVGIDAKAFIVAAQQKLDNLVAVVNSASAAADINAVTW